MTETMNFEEISKKAGDKSSVWHYFFRAQDKTSAKCKKCQKILKCAGGSTSGLQKHLKNVHQISLSAARENPAIQTGSSGGNTTTPIPSTSTDEVPKKKTKLTEYYECDTNPCMEVMISRMTALRGYPFQQFVECEDLRRLFKTSGHTLPKSVDTIQSIIVKVAIQKKVQLTNEIKKLLKEGHKFSLTFDEWTSVRNRRYLSLNLHSRHFSGGNNFKNLGLIRVYGSLPAKKCVEVISVKLNEFGVSLENDIIAATTDGCSMMVKFGKFLSSYHQKCIAHALQLAILDVFYKNDTIEVEEEPQIAIALEDDDDDIPLAALSRQRLQVNRELPDEDSDSENEAEADGAEFLSHNETSSIVERQFEHRDLLLKVKKVVKLFRKSPTKNDNVLQKYVIADFHKEYSLTCDSVTRWSSLANTLERFLKLRTCIVKALIDLNSNIKFSDGDWELIGKLHEVLDIIKTILEALCRRDSTLLTADVAIKFALRKLENIENNYIATKMIKMLKKRYTERRLNFAAATLNYLQNPENYFLQQTHEDFSLFSRPNSNEMCNEIVSLLNRTKTSTTPVSQSQPLPTSQHSQGEQTRERESDSDVLEVQNIALTKGEELNAELAKAASENRIRPSTEENEDLFTHVKIEMALFENGGDRGRYLSQAYDHLLSIPPTSVEPERVFSSAGLLCNKIRSRLSDQSLDALLFLRSYYRESKKLS